MEEKQYKQLTLEEGQMIQQTTQTCKDNADIKQHPSRKSKP